MYILFLFIHLAISAVFWSFGKTLEMGVFLFLGIIFFIGFFPVNIFDFLKRSNPTHHSQGVKNIKEPNKIRKYFYEFLSLGSYYLAFFFFYLAFYGIIYSVSPMVQISIGNLYGISTLILAIIPSVLFFVYKEKNTTITQIFYSNTIVFSGIYGVLLLKGIFLTGSMDSLYIINSIVSIGFLFQILSRIADYKTSTLPLSICILLCILLPFYIGVTGFWAPIISFGIILFSIIAFILTDVVEYIKGMVKYRAKSLSIGILFSYIVAILTIIHTVYYGVSAVNLFYTTFVIVFQSYLHSKYNIPVSLGISIGVFWTTLIMAGLEWVMTSFFLYALFIFIVAAIFALLGLRISKYRQDSYIFFGAALLHAFGFSVAIPWIFSPIGILEISFLFLWFSSLLFVTYIRFKKS